MMIMKRRITHAYFLLAKAQYAPLIQKLAFQIAENDTQIDDMKSKANDELLKCMICYKYSGSFITFFHGRLVGVFKHMRDAERRANRVQSISADSITKIAGPDRDMSTNMVVQECLECLNEEERAVITGLFFDEKTMREVSEDHGIGPSTVCHIKTQALEKMKQKCMVE